MSSRRPITEQERADLVAYLDGELSGEEARAIEAKISLDPRVRAEAESLKKTWDLLDFLPKTEPSPSFTERTLSRVDPLAAPAEPAGEEGQAEVGRWLVLAGAWGLGLVVSAVAGYAMMRAMLPRVAGERELVRDLRLIENKRYYDQVDDFEFLEKLDHPDLFGDDTVP